MSEPTGGKRGSEDIWEKTDLLSDKLDTLNDVFSEIEEAYTKADCCCSSDEGPLAMARKLQDGLDSARTLVVSLKREKWHLAKKERSVEMRMDELEDYKSHLKQDMTSLNETLELFSARIVQLENKLCTSQDTQENLEAEKIELGDKLKSVQGDKDRLQLRLEKSECKIENLEMNKLQLLEEIRFLQESTILDENRMLKKEVKLLQDENRRLRDLQSSETESCSPKSPRLRSRTISCDARELMSHEFLHSPALSSCESDHLSEVDELTQDLDKKKKARTKTNKWSLFPSKSEGDER